MTESNAVEAVARAIFEDDEDSGLTWDDREVYQDHYRSLACAAIKAYNGYMAADFIRCAEALALNE